jgi:replicative DNA helicase
VCLAQINREAEKLDGKPRLHQLRESGAIEQDADAVVLTWIGNGDGSPGKEAQLIIAKNRHGERDQLIRAVYFGHSCRFEERASGWTCGVATLADSLRECNEAEQ